MKRIVLTGGGSGGHIFPLLAVAEALQDMRGDAVEVLYCGPMSPLVGEFAERGIPIRSIMGSKIRRYASLVNIFEIPKFAVSVVQALVKLFVLMPDAVFSKGGPGAFAVVVAARFFRIPVVIHESDAVPGITNRWSARFAAKIAVSFESSRAFFPAAKTQLTGNPVRAGLIRGILETREAKRILGFSPDEPLLVVLGGSQGAVRLNRFVFDNLETLLERTQILHQVGPANEKEGVSASAALIGEVKKRYRVSGFLSFSELRNALAAADVVLSRAGSGAISEVAYFGKPAVLIPLPEAAGDHQRRNAYEYAERGGAIVLEESNLGIHLVLDAVDSFLKNGEPARKAARSFANPAAAETVARIILDLLQEER